MCFITDINISDDIAKEIDNKFFNNFYLLDHHATALDLNKYKWCNVAIENMYNIKTSGTEIFYRWLILNGYFNDKLEVNESLSKFVELVRDYDTWRWSTLGEKGIICKQVNDLLYLYGRDKFISWCLDEINTYKFPFLSTIDVFMLNNEQRKIDEYVNKKDKKMTYVKLNGYICGIVFAESYQSELGNRLCKMHPEIDFVAIINIDGSVSYRTIKDNIDLGKDIASLFGGGGHPKAAGSPISEETKSMIIQRILYGEYF